MGVKAFGFIWSSLIENVQLGNDKTFFWSVRPPGFYKFVWENFKHCTCKYWDNFIRSDTVDKKQIIDIVSHVTGVGVTYVNPGKSYNPTLSPFSHCSGDTALKYQTHLSD